MTFDPFRFPNVVGHGLGIKTVAGEPTGQAARIVLVSKKLPEVQLSPVDILPQTDDELVVDVMEVGIIRALRTTRHRPAPGGVSIGHYQITAGTLGVVLFDSNNRKVILSNNHVLANSNGASIGDAIYQPGPIDGGGAADLIATLTRFQKIAFEGGCLPLNAGPNIMDAAYALPLDESRLDRNILDVGIITGTGPAVLGLNVQKSGRTTAFTQGVIQVIHAVVQVSYGSAGNAVFEDQIITSNMSQGGDSGSLLANGELAVGLLFAGSDQITIHSPIDAILSTFGLRF